MTSSSSSSIGEDNYDMTSSSDFLAKELELATKQLKEVEEKQEEQVLLAFSSTTSTTNEKNDDDENPQANEPATLKLLRLQTTAESLVLAQKITEWLKNKKNIPKNDIIEESKVCLELSAILLEHSENLLQVAGPSLFEETYLPLYEYVSASMKKLIRQCLQEVQYPSSKGCCSKLRTNPMFHQFASHLLRLERRHNQLLQSVHQNHHSESTSFVVLELLQPIVKRIQYHFVERSEDRVTSCRLDRLPEWIFGYLKEHVLEVSSEEEGDDGSSPIDVVKSLSQEDGDDALVIEFCNHLTRLFHWVLLERNFFRDPVIAGPRSNPLLLYNAMEQFLLYDQITQQKSSLVTPSSTTNHQRHHLHLMTMMDLLMTQDEELVEWWMERERESVFATLFEDDSAVNIPKPLANHVSPRAEVFCALIRSVQYKAAILTSNPGPYLRNVAVPLCGQFVDALHETCNDLRSLLVQNSRDLPSEEQLVSNINEWIEIINGTNLAAQLLLKEGAWQDGMAGTTSQSDHDLARFGRALRKLCSVMIEEFAKAFVETILMEGAKLASYVMLASHILSSEEWPSGGGSNDSGGEDNTTTDLSPELRETTTVLHQFHQLCNSILSLGGHNEDGATDSEDHRVANFAPVEIRTHVMNRIAVKFLDVALDMDNVSPDIWQAGAKVFSRDVAVIIGPSDIPLALRLMDVTMLLCLDTIYIQSLFDALTGLVGLPVEYLDIEDFTTDGTIYDEATSMIKAKGFSYLELEDVVSILNRRRD